METETGEIKRENEVFLHKTRPSWAVVSKAVNFTLDQLNFQKEIVYKLGKNRNFIFRLNKLVCRNTETETPLQPTEVIAPPV